jgi:adenosylhomocysteine nucleosidase
MGSPPIGVITGLPVEAEILKPLEAKGLVRLGVARANEAKAAALAREMAAEGVQALMSFGICGGLVPQVKIGDLILADSVHHHRGPYWATNESWREALLEALSDGQQRHFRVHIGRLTGSRVIVDQPVDKRALAHRCDAIAVDMESHAVAEVADHLKLPLLVVRSCSDTVGHPLPMEALDAISPDGSYSVLPVTKALARRPWLIPPLVRLALHTRSALKTLERVVRAEAALLRRG